jgi:RHS repeat-associated protein
LQNTSDYSPFGVSLDGRTVAGNFYRFGFNGKENDNVDFGEGNFQDYGFRMFKKRLGKFISIDPLSISYPELSSYQFASNTPIWAIDLDGMEAYFTTDGKFDRWGEKKGENAPVIIIKKAGDVEGVKLKNNSSDFKGKDITVKQFLKRSQRIWAEGGREKKTADAYAHAQDNKREGANGNELDNYNHMSSKDFDVYSKFKSYTYWNDKRGPGYENLEGLNLLMGTTDDPTNGAKQWRGTKSAQDLIKKYSESGLEVPIKTLGVEYKGYYITNVTTIITDKGYHTFFDFTRTKPTSTKKP